MTYHRPTGTVLAVPSATSRTKLPPLTGNLAPLRAALADKWALVSRLEANWVAAAEREVAKHLPTHVRIDDRATWDGPTHIRYLAEAEKVEPEFKPRIKRLLGEIDSLERLLSTSAPITTDPIA